ncbi:L-threonylcarbamoyladenylate synthase [Planctomicrobium sp. SH661]|uniref:L-threonylcarbamoyladenylate synthase n=1 Tax=Planctomicrobium sp. SH661 TaxID=3448124 RepID=UPI003F5B1523
MPAELTDNIELAAGRLKTGGLVAFATETVYGLGANALDVTAVAKVFAAKKRPHFDPLIVHIADVSEIETLVTDVPEVARTLMQKFWPGPLTLVLPKAPCVPDLVTAGLPGVAVRVPDHPQARELIRRSGVPVAAPSANPFGRISPTTAEHVMDSLGEQIDLVLQGGACRIGVESTVLHVLQGEVPLLLRPGGLPREAIEAEIGPIAVPTSEGDDGTAQVAPGRLLKHYAPRKRLLIVEDWTGIDASPSDGALSLQPFQASDRFGQVEVLSESGNLNEAAASFFAALRRLDENPGIDRIFATRLPDEGLGLALNDRLTRAAR